CWACASCSTWSTSRLDWIRIACSRRMCRRSKITRLTDLRHRPPKTAGRCGPAVLRQGLLPSADWNRVVVTQRPPTASCRWRCVGSMRRPAVARLVRAVPLTPITFEIHTVASPLFRLGLRGVLVALPLALVPHSSVAQIGVTTDIIIGAVTGPDSQPLTGATVQVTSRETQVTQQRTTDVRGRFTIVFSDGG